MTDNPAPIRLGLRPELLADVAAGAAEAAIGPAGGPPSWLRVPTTWGRRVAFLLVGVAVVVALFAATAAQLEALGLGSFAAAVVAGLQTVPLLALPHSPLLVWRWLACGLVAGVALLAPERAAWPWPVTSLVLLAGVLYLVAGGPSRRTAIGAWVLTTLVVLAPVVVLTSLPAIVPVVLAGALALVMLVGDSFRDRRAVRQRLETATAQRRQDLARQAVLTERAHIARELHDVVAHHMSMIAVQAEAAPLRYPDLSPDAARTFAVIRDASREALTEMRRVVGALRNEEDFAESAPQPGADGVVDLVEASRRNGMDVALSVTGTARPLPAAVDVSVYRLVQEALSNARRHAPGAVVRVELGYEADRVRVRVADDGAVPSA